MSSPNRMSQMFLASTLPAPLTMSGKTHKSMAIGAIGDAESEASLLTAYDSVSRVPVASTMIVVHRVLSRMADLFTRAMLALEVLLSPFTANGKCSTALMG